VQHVKAHGKLASREEESQRLLSQEPPRPRRKSGLFITPLRMRMGLSLTGLGAFGLC
jgi:hypothetical protein